MATHSNIFARKIPWTEDPGGLQFMGSLKSQTRLSMHTHTHTHCALEALTMILKYKSTA